MYCHEAQEAFLIFNNHTRGKKYKCILTFQGSLQLTKCSITLSTHNSHSCPKTAEPPSEPRSRSMRKHQPCFHQGWVTSLVCWAFKPTRLKDQACGPRNMTEWLQRPFLGEVAPRTRAPLLSPLCWHWPGVLNSYLFHCRGFSGKESILAHKCWCDMKENFCPLTHGHTAFLLQECTNASEEVAQTDPVTQHRLEEMGHSAVQNLLQQSTPTTHTSWDTQRPPSSSRLLICCTPYPFISAVLVLTCFHRQGISGCHGFH